MSRGGGFDRGAMQGVRRLVVKVGSSLVTNQGKGLDGDAIAEWVGQITELLRAGVQVVLVSSGAVAEGRARLGMSQRPRTLRRPNSVVCTVVCTAHG